jgi:hypothetical protein
MRSRRVLAVSMMALAVATQARGDGPPATDPLVYSGVLEEGGAPVTGLREVKLVLWNDPTLSAPANRKCETTPQAKAQVAAGRFRVPLDPSCEGAVKANPELWVEVIVENQSLGRSKLGAVPFAIEAGRAAEASGALRARLESLPKYTNPTTGKVISFNGSYCGLSVPATGNISGGAAPGYPAAKVLCEQVCGTPTAHVCTPVEMLRYVATGGVLPTTGDFWHIGRVEAGSYGYSGTTHTNDCWGWTSTSTSSPMASMAWRWHPSILQAGHPYSATCSGSTPVLCCN